MIPIRVSVVLVSGYGCRKDQSRSWGNRIVAAGIALLATVGLAGCGANSLGTNTTVPPGIIAAVGAESQYADVISQIGGQYVSVQAVMSNPNTDPHTYEASTAVARQIAQAQLIVQNGLGYDDFMTQLEKSAPNPARTVITAQSVLGLPDSTPNPHLWYKPETMPAVAQAIADALSAIQPDHASYFQANLATFTTAMTTWQNTISQASTTLAGQSAAVTEPVGDYLIQALGLTIKTPWSLEQATMNGTDLSPQDAAAQDALLAGKQVALLCYNQQVTDPSTTEFLQRARAAGVPVVAVYEIMPTGYTYQQWMNAEVQAIVNAVTNGTSTEQL